MPSTGSSKTNKYREQLKDYDDRYYLLLEDFHKFYILFNLDSYETDASSAYNRQQGMLDSNKNAMFTLKTNIERQNNKLQSLIVRQDKLLKLEEYRNNSLILEDNSLKNLDAAAIQMLKDKNVIYNKRLVTAFNIVVGIIATSYIIYGFQNVWKILLLKEASFAKKSKHHHSRKRFFRRSKLSSLSIEIRSCKNVKNPIFVRPKSLKLNIAGSTNFFC
jgi:hypothetical protein